MDNFHIKGQAKCLLNRKHIKLMWFLLTINATLCKQFQSISKYIYAYIAYVHIMLRAQHSLLHPNHDWRLVFQMLHHWPLRGSGRHHHFDPSCKTLYEPFNSCGTVPVRLHGRMASVSYQFRFCWVDASLMFTDWTPFGSWLCGNNGALSILNFSVISTWVDPCLSSPNWTNQIYWKLPF